MRSLQWRPLAPNQAQSLKSNRNLRLGREKRAHRVISKPLQYQPHQFNRTEHDFSIVLGSLLNQKPWMSGPAGTKLGTRLAFFAAGVAVAGWAALVPFAKARLGADDRLLGLILLCVGIGSVLAMPVTGWLSARWGSKPMIIGGGVGLVALLPVLAVASRAADLGLALLGFGASLGTLDVAMNTHAVEVEKSSRQTLMAGFHAFFSVGGIIGAGSMTWMLSQGLSPLAAASAGAGIAGAAILLASPRLLRARGAPVKWVLPHGFVMLIAVLTAIAFLMEGAIADWGALLVIQRKIAGAARGGLGYMFFSAAMTIGRFTGNGIITRYGNLQTLVWGALGAIGGFVAVLLVTVPWISMSGFLLIGLGAANIVPVLFRLAGHQAVMPPALAMAAVTTTGYAGILAGPAVIGLVSHEIGLPGAFWMLAALMTSFPLLAKRVAKGP